MMQTLIGGDGVVMTLSGRIEISSQDTRTVIEGHPGVGIKPQRIVLNGLKILDVETLPEAARPLVTVERLLADDDNLAPAFRLGLMGHREADGWPS